MLKELAMEVAEDWKEIELFERGAKTLQSLRHPGIPAFIDAFNDPARARFYLVQEYIEGVSLREKLAHRGSFSDAQVREFLGSMLDILEYLHGLSPPVIHRDIKPSNIIMRPDGTFSLIDFDVVQTMVPDEVGGSTVVGTSGYMPPEQLIGRAQPASDLFALAATAVHLRTGVEPAQLPMRRATLDLDALEIADLQLKTLLGRLLQPVPGARPGLAEVRASLARQAPLTPRPLTDAQLHDIQRFEKPLEYQRWVRISLKDRDLWVEIFSRPHQTLRTVFGGPAIGALAVMMLFGIVGKFTHLEVVGLIGLVCWASFSIMIYLSLGKTCAILFGTACSLMKRQCAIFWCRCLRSFNICTVRTQ